MAYPITKETIKFNSKDIKTRNIYYEIKPLKYNDLYLKSIKI